MSCIVIFSTTPPRVRCVREMIAELRGYDPKPGLRFGSVQMRLVRGAGKRIVGGYITYEKVRGMVFVLQMFAEPSAEELVANALLARAAEGGFAAVRGQVQPEFMDALVRQQSVLFRRSCMVVHSRNAELLAALRTGNALITGLAAEAWTRLIGDDFT